MPNASIVYFKVATLQWLDSVKLGISSGCFEVLFVNFELGGHSPAEYAADLANLFDALVSMGVSVTKDSLNLALRYFYLTIKAEMHPHREKVGSSCQYLLEGIKIYRAKGADWNERTLPILAHYGTF
jgi:hypothetical protein